MSDEAWKAVRSALTSWGRTLRLCLILSVLMLPLVAGLLRLAIR
jgi:hypothetical protein